MLEGRGILVLFFGRPASTMHAPAILAWSTGAPILPVSIRRLEGGRHRVDFDLPVELDRDANREEEIVRVTTRINQWLEGKIRAEPSQWLWIHRRWKIPVE
jgi:Kdo2-lipid IVA lauroyltransferase/acyltransferase